MTTDAKTCPACDVMLAALQLAWKARLCDPILYRAAHAELSAEETLMVEAVEAIEAAIEKATGNTPGG